MVKVHIDKVVENMYMLRLDDDEVKYFEALWSIPEGITYNSYILLTDEGAILFDSWKHTYSELFLETLRKVVDLKDIKYIIIHHMEQDHSGSIPKILEVVNDNITVVGHPIVRDLISSFYRVKFSFKAVKDLEGMVVGGKKLRFIYIPWLHWPDTIATYIEDLKALLSCDAFGGYGIPSMPYDDDPQVVERYLPFVRKYVATVVGHYREHIVKNIEKITGLNLEIKMIAPAHGLVWRNNPKIIVDYYYKLGLAEPDMKKIVVVYSSMYGLMEKSIEVIIDELTKKNLNVKVFTFTDKNQAAISDIIGDSIDAYAIILGASTYENELFPQIEYVIKMLVNKVNAEKFVAVVNTFGWGKVSGDYIKSLFDGSRFKIVEVVNIRGTPENKDIEKLRLVVQKLL
uniref:FprA family A-type flavoprotein n=1 Tax=Ignisphaera aggregans TaxID=334771 RepID=A0A832C8W1_9CREN